jgi:hypothetical protein
MEHGGFGGGCHNFRSNNDRNGGLLSTRSVGTSCHSISALVDIQKWWWILPGSNISHSGYSVWVVPVVGDLRKFLKAVI